MTTPSDVWVQVTSANSSSERRLPLSWSVAVLKARLEPITGIPRSSQRLILRRGGDGLVSVNEGGGDGRAAQTGQVIEAADEEDTTLEHFRLTRGCEIYVCMALTRWLRDPALALLLGLGTGFVWMRCFWMQRLVLKPFLQARVEDVGPISLGRHVQRIMSLTMLVSKENSLHNFLFAVSQFCNF